MGGFQIRRVVVEGRIGVVASCGLNADENIPKLNPWHGEIMMGWRIPTTFHAIPDLRW